MVTARDLLGRALAVHVGPRVSRTRHARRFTIQSVTYGGSGCPPGTTGQSFNDARTSLTGHLRCGCRRDGRRDAAEEFTRECQVTLSLHVPAGASLARVRVSLRGYANLLAGMTSVVTSGAALEGESPLDTHDESLAGPTADDYLVTREFDLATSEVAETVRPSRSPRACACRRTLGTRC